MLCESNPVEQVPCEETLLDMKVVDELRGISADNSWGFVSRLFDIFTKDTEEALARLSAAADAGDLDRIGRIAHSVKSSAAAVGATGLSNLCRTLEERVRQQEEIDLKRSVLQMQTTYAMTRDAMNGIVSRS